MTRDWNDQDSGRVLKTRDVKEVYKESALRKARMYRRVGNSIDVILDLADPKAKLRDDSDFRIAAGLPPK